MGARTTVHEGSPFEKPSELIGATSGGLGSLLLHPAQRIP